MEQAINRYSTIGGAFGCVLGICLMYPGDLLPLKVVEQRINKSLGFLKYENTDIKFLKPLEVQSSTYQLKVIVADSLPVKVTGLSITILSALAMYISAENAQRECEEGETRENVEKLADMAVLQQKQEARVLFEAKKNEIDGAIEYKLYQEQKRREFLKIMEQDPHQSEDIDSLYYQYQEGFYDEPPQTINKSAEPMNQPSTEGSSNPSTTTKVNVEPLNQQSEPLNQPDNEVSSQNENHFTPLGLNRLQISSLIEQLKQSGLNQTEIIEHLWQVKKGGSLAWRKAHLEFKELTEEKTNEEE